MIKIYTLGTSNRSINEFLEIVKYYQIQTVIDVRHWPTSHLFPHFKKENLKKILTKNNIEYKHLKKLGGYRPRGYESYTKTKEFKKTLKELIEISKSKNTLIICAERLPWKCHRSFITKILEKKGFQIIHIIEKNKIWQPQIELREIKPKCEHFKKFLNCQINLSNKVFIPRVETEFWVSKAIKIIQTSKKHQVLKILDIFAGSGCIGIAILKNIKKSKVDFVDIDDRAINQIKINLKLNNIHKTRYKIQKSNLFEKLKKKQYDYIFANPPYVALDRIDEVQKEVLKTESPLALFAGKDGLFYIQKFFKEVEKYLKPNGKIFLEFDPFQKEKIKEILENKFRYIFYKDQFGKYRWLEAFLKND